jgi:hypothetical protein
MTIKAVGHIQSDNGNPTPETAPPDFAETQRNRGVAQKESGNHPAAVACWREAEKYYRLIGAADDADKMRQWIAGAE